MWWFAPVAFSAAPEENFLVTVSVARLLQTFAQKVTFETKYDFTETEPIDFCQLGLGDFSFSLFYSFIGTFVNSEFHLFLDIPPSGPSPYPYPSPLPPYPFPYGEFHLFRTMLASMHGGPK